MAIVPATSKGSSGDRQASVSSSSSGGMLRRGCCQRCCGAAARRGASDSGISSDSSSRAAGPAPVRSPGVTAFKPWRRGLSCSSAPWAEISFSYSARELLALAGGENANISTTAARSSPERHRLEPAEMHMSASVRTNPTWARSKLELGFRDIGRRDSSTRSSAHKQYIDTSSVVANTRMKWRSRGRVSPRRRTNTNERGAAAMLTSACPPSPILRRSSRVGPSP